MCVCVRARARALVCGCVGVWVPGGGGAQLKVSSAPAGRSRLWGAHHERSDCDVFAVYVQPTRAYFSLLPPPTPPREAFEGAAGTAPVEVTLCEAKHACRLLAEHNPTLVEEPTADRAPDRPFLSRSP